MAGMMTKYAMGVIMSMTKPVLFFMYNKQANEKVVILHMKTNKALGVVTDYNNPSKFEIVANTFLNSHKAEEDVNHFKFVTNLPQVPVPQRLDD